MAYLTSHAETQQKVKGWSRASAWRGLAPVFLDWAWIVSAVSVSFWVGPPKSPSGILAYAIAIVVIASRQQSLLVLTHDGIHRTLCRPFWLNDAITRIFAAFPTFVSVSKWRFIHLLHHAYTFTDADPDVAIFARYPLDRKKARRLMVKDLCGRNVFSNLKYFIDLPWGSEAFNDRFLGEERAAKYRAQRDMRQFWIFWGLVLVGIGVVFGSTGYVYFLAYWIFPYVTLA